MRFNTILKLRHHAIHAFISAPLVQSTHSYGRELTFIAFNVNLETGV